MIRSTSSLVSVSSSFWLLCRFLSSVSCLLCHFLSSVSCPITLPDRCVLFSVVPPLPVPLALCIYSSDLSLLCMSCRVLYRLVFCFLRALVIVPVLCFVIVLLSACCVLLSCLCIFVHRNIDIGRGRWCLHAWVLLCSCSLSA